MLDILGAENSLQLLQLMPGLKKTTRASRSSCSDPSYYIVYRTVGQVELSKTLKVGTFTREIRCFNW